MRICLLSMSSVDERIIVHHLRTANSKHVDLVKEDVMAVLRVYYNLKSDTELYTFPNGDRGIAFKIFGTIPVQFKSAFYNIPISIHLWDSHPYYAPICHVVPTASMVIQESENVNNHGRIFLQYLREWRFPGYDLLDLVQIITMCFQERCPLFNRPEEITSPPPHNPFERPQEVHEEKHVENVEADRNAVQNEEFASDFMTRFKPKKVLGMGGFGCVFEAQNVMDEWKYAVKRIHLRGSSESVNAALKEVRTLASFKHEGIVSYNSSWIERPPSGWQKRVDAVLFKKLDFQEKFTYSDDCVFIYIQMELCKETLDNWLKTNQARDLNRAKSWFKQLVSAIAYLHKKNKIHRDLKPCNILFDVNGRLKICDLGLVAERALSNGREVNIKRTIAGTRMYMAPEQCRGNYTSKVDIFSLGLILTELCVHMTPFEAFVVFTNYQGGRQTNILKHLPEVNKIVSWLTNADPKKRPNCEEILALKFLA